MMLLQFAVCAVLMLLMAWAGLIVMGKHLDRKYGPLDREDWEEDL